MAGLIAGTYEIIEQIGSGGGGNVFLANHLRLGKKVVLKADKRKITTAPELLRREVDVLKELSHSYIPQVYDFFVEGETVYTVIDFIEGESLDKPLKRGETFSQERVIKWAKQLLEALAYLHSPTHGTPPHGFVHSDIKPANIMLTSNDDICLIDFNISLALGEENAIGCSAGYASPEHYGLDFSTSGDTATAEKRTEKLNKPPVQAVRPGNSTASLETEALAPYDAGGGTEPLYPHLDKGEESTLSLTDVPDTPYVEKQSSTASRQSTVVPDIRSDIYSVGATLYHLLSGTRPAKNAKEVIALSEAEFSPQIVKIITKAMNPNPDLRYQTADEMLYALTHLHENDPRLLRLKRRRKIVCTILTIVLVAGVLSAFTGLKRMQRTERWLKLSEYSQNALQEGDSAAAIRYAREAIPTSQTLFTPDRVAEAQKALTDALGVYDLSDGFKTYEVFELPSEPLYIALSPDGTNAACIYTGSMVVFDTERCESIVTLPVEQSALLEVEYLDNSTIVYAGENGVTAYNLEASAEVWSGAPATAISVSGDGKYVAAVYKDESFAIVYDATSGQISCKVDFSGRHQQVQLNDSFANPNNNLFALNQRGDLLAVSFADGSLQIYDLSSPDETVAVLDEGSGYTHFEGGFSQQYFAFSASNASQSVFAIIDTENMEQTGGFQDETAFGVQADAAGIYVQSNNFLVKMDPVTGEQTPLVTTSENIQRFAISRTHTLAAGKDSIMFFDHNAALMSKQENDINHDFVQIAEGVALIGGLDSPVIRILRYENHPDTEIMAYDAAYDHNEARISGDGKTVTLFSYDKFRVYSREGRVLAEVSLPNADQVYDQQFIRDQEGSRLEVTYNDGTVVSYSAEDGTVCGEKSVEPPDLNIVDRFETDRFRIESPLHGTPQVYDIKSGKLFCELEEDAYLTYVTQVGDYIVTQYITANDGHCYGQLLNQKWEVLAELPYLCDVYDEMLYFDYPSGNVRQSRIFDIGELLEIAQG